MPTINWFFLLKEVEKFFKADLSGERSIFNKTTSEEKVKMFTAIESVLTKKENCLFHFSSLHLSEDADKNNTDVIFIINLLKNSFSENYKIFEENLKYKKMDEVKNRWNELLFENRYLPELVIHARDISWLSRVSLCGFSIEEINRVKKKYLEDITEI